MVALGFHSTHFSPMFGGTAPLRETVAATAASGFELFGLDQLSVASFATESGSDEPAASTELAALLDDTGLRCSDVVVFAAAEGLDVLASAQRLADLAAALRSPVCIGAVAGAMGWPALCEQFVQASDVFHAAGVTLGIEFVPYSPLDTLDAALRLCDTVGWDRCGLVLDSLHWFRAGTADDALADLDASQIALVQCSDAPLRRPADIAGLADESRHHRLVPGDGELPLRRWAHDLLALGYDGVVSAEVLSDDLRSRGPVAAADACFRALVDLWC